MEPSSTVPALAGQVPTPEGQTDSPKAKSRTRKGGKSKGKKDNLPYLAQLSSVYQKQECKERLGEAFNSKTEYHLENEATLHSNPFPCCVLPKFIKEERFLEGLRDELMDQIFCEKNNDLYKFQQTDDLRKLSAPHVRAIRKLLYGTFLDWMREVTGIALTDQVDLTCSRYDHTDVLLCHDDELDSRRIAFILYLVPPWKAQDGGSLDLFTMDEHGQPSYINRSIQPAWNTLAWFEVTEASHHQVSEVLTEDKTRLSVNGWFHGPIVARPDRYVEPPLPLKPYVEMEESVFRDWINPIYLDPEVQCQIQERFETESEIELQGFLKEEKYHALLAALRGEKIKWVQKGPGNKRRFFKAKDDEEDLPKIVTECMAFLQSEAMFLTLANLTGLTLHPLANQSDSEDEGSGQENCPESPTVESAAGSLEGEDPRSSSESEISCTEKAKPRKKRRKLNSDSLEKATKSKANKDGENEEKTGNPRCRCELRKWTHGCYTLLHDTDRENCEYALDAMLFCFCKGWQQEYGGFTSYIAKDEDEELLSVNPAENSLALVYRDKDTLRFVKHINSQVNQMQNGGLFFDFASVYYE